MKIRAKFLLLAALPALVMFIAAALMASVDLNALSKASIDSARVSLLDAEKGRLKNVVESTVSGIQDILRDSNLTTEQKKEAIYQRLKPVQFGTDGYIFGYTSSGVRVLLGPADKGIGNNYWNLQDKKGVYLIQEIVKQAKAGGGYVEYYFPKPGQQEAEPKLSYSVYLPQLDWVVGTGLYIDHIDKSLAKIEQKQSEELTKGVWLFIAVGVVVLGVILAIASYVANRMTGRIVRIQESLMDISQGDGDLTQRLPVISQDEIGSLAEAFNLFVDKIHQTIQRVFQVVDDLNQTSTKMDHSASGTNASVQAQHQETEMVATAMNQMNASSVEVAQSAGEANRATNSAQEDGSQALTVVQQTSSAISQLASEIDTSAQAIEALGNDVEAIVSILDVIRGIAEQTNLLALNAAIEAARAGEQGRGFAVVADEVRALAGRTQESTAEIQAMIERLQNGSREAITAMGKSKSVGESAVEHSAKASESLQQISAAIDHISNMNAHIATAAEEQTSVSQSIDQSVSRIAESSRETRQYAEETSEASSNLAKISSDLQRLLNQFKV